jgi:hypothetical protein
MKLISLNTSHCIWARISIYSFCLQVLGSCTPVPTSNIICIFSFPFVLNFTFWYRILFYTLSIIFHHFMNTIFDSSCLDLSSPLLTFCVSSSLLCVLYLSNGKKSQQFLSIYYLVFIHIYISTIHRHLFVLNKMKPVLLMWTRVYLITFNIFPLLVCGKSVIITRNILSIT